MRSKGVEGKKSGRTGMDHVEIWWKSLKHRDRIALSSCFAETISGPPLLLHIEEAQLVPVPVLAELIYVITLVTTAFKDYCC